MAVHYVPQGFHSVNPYLVVKGSKDLIEFLKQAFDAEERMVMPRPDGTVAHAELKIGDSIVETAEATDSWPAKSASLHVYVPDVDATYRRALDAGGKSLQEPQDMFYGERSAGVQDPSGNDWFIATHTEDLSAEEMERRAAEAMKQGDH